MTKYTKAQLQDMALSLRSRLIAGDPRAELVVIVCATHSGLPLDQVQSNIERYAAGKFNTGEASDS